MKSPCAAHFLDLSIDGLDLLLKPQLQVIGPTIQLLDFLFEVAEVALIDTTEQVYLAGFHIFHKGCVCLAEKPR